MSAAQTEMPTAEAAAAPAASSPSGIKAWLPLIITVAAMPILAFVTVNFLILPKIQKTLGHSAAAPAEEHAGDTGHAAPAEHGAPAAAHDAKGRVMLPLREKILVNLAGTMGTRYLVVNFTVVGTNPALRKIWEENEAQIRDLAGSVLSAKTISDLERPAARNLIRSELITVLNSALGPNLIQEIYFTDFAVQ